MSSLGARITGSPDGPGDLIASRGHRRDSAAIMHQCIRPRGVRWQVSATRRRLKEVPGVISAIIVKPLAKTAEDRYQAGSRPQERPSELTDRIEAQLRD